MSEATEHARFSPSKMERILSCPGSLALEETCTDTVSAYAAEGTAAHQLAQWTLTDGRFYTQAYLGRIIEVIEKKGTPQEERFEFEVDDDMCEAVQEYVDDIRKRIEAFELLGARVEMFVEQKIDISRILGVPNQFGTADCILLVVFPGGDTLLVVIDLKYGKGVEVVATNNKQLKTYGAGTLDLYDMVNDVSRVLLVINMPRLNYVSEWELSADELRDFYGELKAGAQLALENTQVLRDTNDASKLTLSPGEKQCRFCKAKGKCPALAVEAISRVVSTASVDDFDDLTALEGNVGTHIKESLTNFDAAAVIDEETYDKNDCYGADMQGVVTRSQLAEFMEAADLIEDWLGAVRARVYNELMEGQNAPGLIPGWMLGAGRRGHRAWSSVALVEETLKSMRVKSDEMYNYKLISPAQAEKQFKGNPRRWSKLQKMIFQPEGKPTVTRDNDPKKKRLVVKSVVDDFDDLDAEADYSDLV